MNIEYFQSSSKITFWLGLWPLDSNLKLTKYWWNILILLPQLLRCQVFFWHGCKYQTVGTALCSPQIVLLVGPSAATWRSETCERTHSWVMQEPVLSGLRFRFRGLVVFAVTASVYIAWWSMYQCAFLKVHTHFNKQSWNVVWK